MIRVKIYATLRPIVGSAVVPSTIQAGDNVQILVDELVTRWPELRPEMLDENDKLLQRIHIFINGRSIRYLDQLETIIPDGTEVDIFPPVGGG